MGRRAVSWSDIKRCALSVSAHVASSAARGSLRAPMNGDCCVRNVAEESSGTTGVEPVVLVRREDVGLRLFAFPHAGGGPQSFAEWPAGLPADVEVVSYELPGRGRRRTEPSYADR